MQLDAVDLTSIMGKLVVTMLAAVAEMERGLNVERTVAGLKRTKAQGTILGSPLKHEPSKFATMLQLLNSGEKITNVAYRFGISERQLYRLRKEYSGENGLTTYTNKYNMQQLQRGGVV
jgi:DNA invertase Pin-like site-specific DNA recombinase